MKSLVKVAICFFIALNSATGLHAMRMETPAASEELITAACEGNREQLQALLKAGIDINIRGFYGRTTLMHAALNNQLPIVEILLKHPTIEVNAGDSEGVTALMLAAECGHLNVVNALLTHPSMYVNAHDRNGCTALWQAAYRGHLRICMALIEQGAFDNAALIAAATAGNLEIVNMFLADHRYDVNVHDNRGWTALIEAADHGHLEVLGALLTQPDIDINARTNHGRTALDKAAPGSAIERALLAYGARRSGKCCIQ